MSLSFCLFPFSPPLNFLGSIWKIGRILRVGISRSSFFFYNKLYNNGVFFFLFLEKYLWTWNLSFFNYCISAPDYSNKGRRREKDRQSTGTIEEGNSKNVPGFIPCLEQQKPASQPTLTFIMYSIQLHLTDDIDIYIKASHLGFERHEVSISVSKYFSNSK